jgi:small subunit ribosomal protein S6
MPTLIPSSDDVRVYEVAVLYQPDLDQKSEAVFLKEISGLFAEVEGKLLFQDPWSKRGLAYKIGGFREAKCVIYYYEMPPVGIRELDRQLRLLKGVLRHMIVIPPKGYEAISYEDHYQQWLKTRESAAEVTKHKKEEHLRQTVVAQAKRTTKRLETRKQEVKEPLKVQELEKQLEKLISDDDLKL